MDQAGASAPPASPPREALLQPGGPKAPGNMGSERNSHARADLSEKATVLGTPHTFQVAQEAASVLSTRCVAELITGSEATHWARLLVLDHLDPGSRLALYRTCVAARDRVLATAGSAKGSMAVNDPADLARIRQVRNRLQTRGNLPTKLVLRPSSSNMLSFALGALEAGTMWLEELELGALPADESSHSSAIEAIARCCPNLRALSLNVPTPPHQRFSQGHLPKLQELCIWSGKTQHDFLFRMAAPYIKQLTVLRLYPRPVSCAPGDMPALLFTPGTILTHLTTLHLPVTLNNTLLGLLLECAPALEVLNVCSVQLEADTHEQAQVRWRELATHKLHLSSLARISSGQRVFFNRCLPDPEAALTEHHGYPTVVCDIVGGEAWAAAGLRQVWMDSHDMVLQPGEAVSVADQPAALRVGLGLLHTWYTRTGWRGPQRITLRRWTMSQGLMLALKWLPRFANFLIFRELVWLPGPLRYTNLLDFVPDCYQTVVIHPAGLHRVQLQNICLGASNYRPGQLHTGLKIKVWGAPEQVRAIQAKMKLMGFYFNVTVSSFAE